MKRINLLLVLVITGLVFQLLWEGWVWSLVVFQPETHKPSDFIAFYTAGRIAASGSYHLLYDIQTELQIQESVIGGALRVEQLLPFIHPPVLVPILQFISTPDYLASYWRWVLVAFIFFVGSAVLMERILHSLGWTSGTRLLLLVAALSFYPVFASLLKGQDTTFLILGGMIWLVGMLRGKDWLAGLGLALTVIRPQIAIVLAVPFVFNRPKVWWWFAAGALMLALYSTLLVGVSGVRDFIHLESLTAGGQGYGLNESYMFNSTGMLLRFFPAIQPAWLHGLTWAIFAAVLVGLSILWKISPFIRMRELVLASCLAIFASPHLHLHDLGFLLIPIMGLIIIGAYKGQPLKGTILPSSPVHPATNIRPGPTAWVALLLAASLLMLFAELWDPALYTIPYLLMAAIPLAAWQLDKAPKNQPK